jgi:hypothetical protein
MKMSRRKCSVSIEVARACFPFKGTARRRLRSCAGASHECDDGTEVLALQRAIGALERCGPFSKNCFCQRLNSVGDNWCSSQRSETGTQSISGA